MTNIPFIPSIIIATLLVLGGIVTLIGSLGLLRFNDFTGRIHATTLGNTLGALFILAASMMMSWHINDRVFLHEIIIVLFLFITSPVSAMLLMRSYTLRQERMESN
ncbi:monovalent cation/H(+) antiporter subunit G [Pelistega suis]|uniref:monovalent cation/H(+) antiporter subunit G n=1 Tax=Pelistega suis TaxID=1631957 RepID=UPI00211C5828|nr:monovalent cation/H(+) antiporter subunit G [Pelistega suis]MCQ9328748.1 monovalent cation/H(+) antiporter subunit G [Pelistega suis]